MNIVLLAVVIVLLLVCIVLVSFLIIKNNKEVNSSLNTTDSKSSFFNDGKLEFENLSLPLKIEKLDSHTLFQACSKIFDSFKALDYTHKTEHEIDKIEWHSWQVSLLLALLKKDRSFFIPQSEKLLNRTIIQCSSKQVEEHIKRILIKYEQNVNINKTRDELSKDVIWSASEVSFIFYYMTSK